ncbi:GntR family transcriptional regulator [Aquabacter spiritensis]|uniref:DNA-binding GntR family transcriptional regulator n=1 Tax=Aquabacter spiritensis TaxID=933073 RepID=A0A4R3LZ81_9HYPH|nr:GntR family transcriptional regulator [Aquabacter spiritensis]TCT06054.1 DNA-binding GntR family transcriptional regulator [Aquabacter spiritensis]
MSDRTPTARLKHRTLSAAIVDQLRSAILNGTHAAGTQLRQDALAEAYGVSRIPVREALFQLEAEGLVRITPQKGAIVSELSVAEITDVFELRAILEPRLLAASLPGFDAADIVALEEIQGRFVAATSARDIGSFGILNAAFHMALYRHADLPRTQIIVGSLLQTSDRYTRVQLSSEAAMAVAVAEHAELIALCRAGAAADAVALLRRHIETVHRDLLRVIESA